MKMKYEEEEKPNNFFLNWGALQLKKIMTIKPEIKIVDHK
jgi:hypothetical protein